ncbi:MAG: zinc ribbon domain-containing protein [Firmicutes bacterium]|nr:zinc ribbon domain-containing protein [Bacillota bacterium]
MAGKIKSCKHCGAEIAKSAKVCPKCGGKNRRPNGCLIAIGIIFIWSILAYGFNGARKPPANDTVQGGTGAVQNNIPNSPDTNGTEQKLLPTAIFGLLSMEFENSVGCQMNSDSAAFMNAHPDFFPWEFGGDDFMPYVDFDIKYSDIMGAGKQYGNKLMYVTGKAVLVEKLSAAESSTGMPASYAVFYDENNNYYCVYCLDSIKVSEGDNIEVVGLPIGTSSLTSSTGGEIPCIVIAGVQTTQLAG